MQHSCAFKNGFRNMKISDIRAAVKNENRVNVFVDGKYEFSLDISQFIDFKIKVGAEITEAELLEFKKASEFGKLYQRSLEWVLVRPRSIRETEEYLRRKQQKRRAENLVRKREEKKELPEIDTKTAELVLVRLLERGYLDDLRFAEYYVENRFVKKGVSRRRLEMELLKKGVSRNIVAEVLAKSGRDEKEEILKIITKKRNKYTDEKLISYLCRQGFSFELVQNLVRSFGTD